MTNLKIPFLFFFIFLILLENPLFSSGLSIRDTEPIIVSAEKFPELLGKPIEKINFYSYHQKKLQPIPWQWDPINLMGWVDFSAKKEASVLSSRDQLMWLSGDMGEKASKKILDLTLKETSWIQIEVGRKDENSRFVYANFSEQNQKKSQEDYITYHPEKDKVITPYFYVGYRDIIIANQFGWINKDHTFGRNLIYEVGVLFKTRIFFGLIPIKISEKNLIATQLGFRDGAIRVTQRLKSHLKLPLGLKGPSNTAESYFYSNRYQTKIDIDFPRGGKALIKDSSFKFDIMLTPIPGPGLIHLPPNHILTIESSMKPKDYLIMESPPPWAQVSEANSKKGFVVFIDIPKSERKNIIIEKLDYVHKPTSTQIGILSLHIKIKTKPGKHFFTLLLFSPPQNQTEKGLQSFSVLRDYQEMVSNPYRIKAIQRIP